MKHISHILILIICMLFFNNEAAGIKAGANIVKYRQPNGSVISLRVYGDEFCGCAKTLSGLHVNKGQDGYFYPAGTIQNLEGSRIQEMGRRHLLRGERKRFLYEYGKSGFSKTRSRSNMVEQVKIESLVLLVEFADVKFTIEAPEEYFNSMLNSETFYGNGATGSAAEYLNDNFGAGYDFSFNVEGVVALTEKMECYGARTELYNDADPARMVREACEAAYLQGVDFSKYDIDNDGIVDNVAIIFAGYNEAESGDGTAIWPHYGNISNENIELSGVKIGGYTCCSEYTGGNMESKPATIGTFLHEFCHCLGLPDMYDVNGDMEGLSNALYGSLSIMDAGNYLNGGNTPPYLTSFEREILALDDVVDIEYGNSYTLPPIHSASRIFRLKSQNEGEYLLFECRNATGWDAYIGGSGMIVYHIDKSGNNVAGLTAASRWEHNVINSYAAHECARVISASHQKSVQENNMATPALFFPGETGNSLLSYNSVPCIKDWSGGGFGVLFEEISFANGVIAFRTSDDFALCDTLPYATDILVQPYQKGAFIEWAPSDGSWQVSIHEPEGGAELFKTTTDSAYIAVEGLEPENEYIVTIHYMQQKLMGEGNSHKFRTLPVISSFPYIPFKPKYIVGDILHIDVQNRYGESNMHKVKINKKQIEEKYYKFTEAGEFHIEVSLFLPDGSVEVINKLIQVKGK